MRAEVASLNQCAVSFLSRADANLCCYYSISGEEPAEIHGAGAGEFCSKFGVHGRAAHIP